MSKMFRVDKAANQISADKSLDMLERVFAVAELVGKGKAQQVKPSSCSQKSSEKHRNENLMYCVDESIICQRTE